MAVGRLSGVWVLEALATQFPEGTERRGLLDYFAGHLVSKKSRPGAKARVARKLYRLLEALLHRGRVELEGTWVKRANGARPSAAPADQPLLTVDLRRKLFTAMLAMDADPSESKATRARDAQAAFLLGAMEAGWSPTQAGRELGLTLLNVHEVLGTAPAVRAARGGRL